jgi:flavin-dependent thymidylate synthase
MKVVTCPSVFVLAKTAFRPSAFQVFANQYDLNATHPDSSDAEALSEVAGRLCYWSFDKPRPGGSAAYLDRIKGEKHGCYDTETDVLTLDGWKNWTEVTPNDQFATLNMRTNEIEYHYSHRLIRYQHSGRMVRVESQGVDLLVTPDHKMLACRTTTVAGRKKEEYSLIQAQNLVESSHAYTKVGDWNSGRGYPKGVMALLGFAIGDGHFNGTNISFHLTKKRKIEWLKQLALDIESNAFEFNMEGNRDTYRVTVKDGSLRYRELFAGIYNEVKEKRIPPGILTESNRESLTELFDGLMESDGSKGRTSESFDTTSSELADQFMHLCLHIGIAANVSYIYDKSDRPTSFGNKPLTRLSVIRRNLKPEVNKFADSVGRSYWVNDFSGEVFCAEVPNNTLFVRRNGRGVWSGNSVIEHASYSFLITGVSRTLTHELVRHRAGWAYSQLSQRYVDESECAFVLPMDIKVSGPSEDEPVTPEFREWKSSCQASLESYVKIVERIKDNLTEKDAYGQMIKQIPGSESAQHFRTELRKRARQTARSVLPGCIETRILATANCRAIRHFLEQRGSVGAEPEIRRLANVILDLVKDDSPLIFGDYVTVPHSDGTRIITTSTGKV